MCHAQVPARFSSLGLCASGGSPSTHAIIVHREEDRPDVRVRRLTTDDVGKARARAERDGHHNSDESHSISQNVVLIRVRPRVVELLCGLLMAEHPMVRANSND